MLWMLSRGQNETIFLMFACCALDSALISWAVLKLKMIALKNSQLKINIT